jgi:hypothetical protein
MSVLNLHLGDNAGFNEGEFATSTYVGLRVSLPMRLSEPGRKNRLIIHTSAIETLADWQAHTVSLDYFFLGYLKDKAGVSNERHPFEIPRFLIDGSPRALNVAVVGRGPGLEDDFILRSIESSGFDLKLGWA